MTSNQTLAERRANAIPRGVASATGIYAARAENAELWDVEGRRFIDFAGGIAVLNVGHRHPKILAAVEQQLAHYTHTAFQVIPYEPYIRLAERLNKLAPIEPAKTIFFTSGAEATENAVKIARSATKRPGVIAFTGGFHGRTLLASAMTGKVNPYKRGFGPFPGEIYHVPFPADALGVTVDDTLRALSALFAAGIEPDRIAAVIVEPVQGEGGFHVAPPELMRALADLRDRYGILLIADEVQTGFARTGRLFAIEHYDVTPDLMTIAKSLAGGFPLSGVIGRADIMDMVEPGGLGGTYGGSPVALAAAHAVLDVVEEEGLNERANRIGDLLRRRLAAAAATPGMGQITDIRGLGAMVAFDVRERDDAVAGTTAKRICARALADGLILLTCGTGETIRLLMPLTIDDALLDEGMRILERALAADFAENAARGEAMAELEEG